jgi:transcriptional regulator with XRE-family HTH domain
VISAEKFGEVIRKLRLQRKMSQDALADKAKLHRNYIGGIERGERNPSLGIILTLSAALGIKPGRLLDRLSHQVTLHCTADVRKRGGGKRAKSI